MKRPLLLACLALTACKQPATEIVVVVDSDFAVPGDAAQIRAQIRDGSNILAEHSFALVSRGVSPSAGQHTLPFSFAVLPWEDDPSRKIAIELGVIGPGQIDPRLVRRAVTSFIDGSSLALPMFLAHACEGMVCDPGQTCGQEGCIAEDVEPAMLSHLSPGRELEPGPSPSPAPTTRRTLSVSRVGDGNGRVFSRSDSALDCGTNCYADYDEGTEVTVEATPEATSVFRGFGPPCEGQNPCRVRLDSDVALSARFEPWPELSVTMSGQGSGRVTASFGDLDCPTRCSAPYAPGAMVTLNAAPAQGSRFQGWSGDCSGTQPTCSLRLDRAINVSASFEPSGGTSRWPVTVTVSGIASPAIESEPAGLDCPGTCRIDVDHGQQLIIRVRSELRPAFRGFTGDCSGLNFECRVTVDHAIQIGASFSPSGPPRDPRYDIDGNGVADVIFAAPHSSASAPNGGQVYVLSGLVQPRHDQASSLPTSWTGPPDAELGTALAQTGDLTGDAKSDLAIGAPGDHQGAGSVQIMALGDQASFPAPGPLTPALVLSGAPGERLGEGLAALRDVSGDGLADLAAWAPGAHAVYIYYGGTNLSSRPSSLADATLRADTPGDGFGQQIVSAGDFNGDGHEDVAVSAPMADVAALREAGRIYLFFGPIAGTRVAGTADAVINGDRSYGHLGSALATPHGFFGDPGPVLAIAGQNMPEVFLHRGRPGFTDRPLRAAELIISGTLAEQFGRGLAAPGDVTADGVPDLLVSAPSHDGVERGAVYLYLGARAMPGSQHLLFQGSCFDAGMCGQESFGMTVAAIGDVDASGVDDFAVGSLYGGGAVGGMNRGRITIFFGGASFSGMSSDSAPVSLIGDDDSGSCAVLPGASLK